MPNGHCGLPVQKTCPHANACLTCPMFITTADSLPQHREHRTQVVQIISAAESPSIMVGGPIFRLALTGDGDALVRGIQRRASVHVCPDPKPDQSCPLGGDVGKFLAMGSGPAGNTSVPRGKNPRIPGGQGSCRDTPPGPTQKGKLSAAPTCTFVQNA